MPVEVVSKTLGHARVSITMDIYRHVLDSERQQAASDLFDSPPPRREGVPQPRAEGRKGVKAVATGLRRPATAGLA